MNNKLPIELKKDNILKKIYNYIKNIFHKQDAIKENTELIGNKTLIEGKETLRKINFESSQKRNKKMVLEEIIQIIEKKPNTLEKLDVEKLELIDKYYEQKIIKCKEKLKKRKAM